MIQVIFQVFLISAENNESKLSVYYCYSWKDFSGWLCLQNRHKDFLQCTYFWSKWGWESFRIFLRMLCHLHVITNPIFPPEFFYLIIHQHFILNSIIRIFIIIYFIETVYNRSNHQNNQFCLLCSKRMLKEHLSLQRRRLSSKRSRW